MQAEQLKEDDQDHSPASLSTPVLGVVVRTFEFTQWSKETSFRACQSEIWKDGQRRGWVVHMACKNLRLAHEFIIAQLMNGIFLGNLRGLPEGADDPSKWEGII